MTLKESLNNLTRDHEVISAAIVDDQGLVIVEAGKLNPVYAARLVHLDAERQIPNSPALSGVMELYHEDAIVLLMRTPIGLLIVEASKEVNLGMLRLNIVQMHSQLSETVEPQS